MDILNLQCLYNRRIKLCENFAENTTKYEKVKSMFPRKDNESKIKTLNSLKFKVAFTKRYKNSSVPFMQRLLSKVHKEKYLTIPHKSHT